MSTFHIDTYSHYFKVTGYTQMGYLEILRFCERLGQKQLVRLPTGRYVPKITKYFAASTRNRKEFRFHIHQLEEFKGFLISIGHYEYQITQTDHKVPFGLPASLPSKNRFPIKEDQITPISYLSAMVQPIKMVEWQTGRGKAQPLDAFVKIPGGWKQMGDMQIGDAVIAKDGSVTAVTGVYPQGKKEIFRVTFADGRTAECCKEHLWKVYRPNRSWESKVVDTTEMMRLKQLSNNRLYIDLIDPEDSPDVDLPIDPYVLGAILGNGHIGVTSLLLSTGDQELVEEVKKRLPSILTINHVANYDYRIARIDRSEKNHYLLVLKQLGLGQKKSYQKFVPEIYLHGSFRQRLELLQGLMDTDGTATTCGSVSFSTTSPELAKAVQYLVRSIGGMADIYGKQTQYTYKGVYQKGLPAFNVGIRHKHPKELFKLQRKAERLSDANQYAPTLKLSVEKIEYVGVKEVQCISIAHPDKLYVTNDFVVTHNTFCTLTALSIMGLRTVIIVRGMYVEKWAKDIQADLDLKSKDVMVVRGGADLKRLIELAQAGELHAKIIIISNRTMYNYLEDYEGLNGLSQVYGCKPEDFYKTIGAGVRVIDETHLDFHLNFRLDLYTNIQTTIDLSATMRPDDAFMDRMYCIRFPERIRFQDDNYDKYIVATALTYRLYNPKHMRFLRKGRKSYSHTDFEQSVLKNKKMSEDYYDLMKQAIDHRFMTVREKGQKLLIFAATVEMCTYIVKRLKLQYGHLRIGRYVEEDAYEDLLSCDICVSTVMSAGTAVDIPGLRMTLMTTALGSSQANLQALGRLRRLKDWPNVTPNFDYFVCTDIQQHIDYHNRKVDAFRGKVLAHNTISMRGGI